MVALCNRADHYIFILWFLLSSSFFFFSSKKNIKQQYVLQMSPQYGELRPTSGCDRFVSLGYPTKFQLVSRLGSVAARHVVVGVSRTLRRWIEGATYVRQGDHVGHWPTFLVLVYFCGQFVAPKIRHSRSHCSVCQQSTWYSASSTRFWLKKLVFEGIHSREVAKGISWEKLDKAWC